MAAVFLCIAISFHIIALGYLYRYVRCRVWGEERYPSMGQFQMSMNKFGGLENNQTVEPQAALPSPDTPSFPAHWVPSDFSTHGFDQNFKMPHVFKVRIVDGKHPEHDKEFVGIADSSDQAVGLALSMVPECEVPLVFSVERVSVLDI